MNITYYKPSELIAAEYNPRQLTRDQHKELTDSIVRFGLVDPLIVNTHKERKNILVGGHQRLKIAQELNIKEIPCVEVELNPDQEKELNIRLNKNSGEWDYDALANNFDVENLTEWGFTDDELQFYETEESGYEERKTLAERFIVPPFSVLDTRQGYWQDRKKSWKELISDCGETREGTLHNPTISTKSVMNKMDSFSLLDPILAELSNKWFGIDGGKTFDCFAGDSVFGYVSSYLGNEFTGIELRKEQAELNNDRIKEFSKSKYICDDGQNVLKHIEINSQDLLFSCPPYFDLEVYSDLKNDASNQKEYGNFLKIIEKAFIDSLKCLKDNRFAVITVGDIRDKKGFYRNFISDVKNIFIGNGALLYNEMILIEVLGSLPLRVGRFMKHRKVGKCHQNVLVFYKGDPTQIKENYRELRFES